MRKERKIIKNNIIKRSVITSLLLLLLAINLASSTLLVSGEAGGTGKYLEINFISLSDTPADNAALLASDCEVTATKISSDQVFTYAASNELSYRQKVGAGTVLLDANADEGWEFCHFIIRDAEFDDLSEYKTEKNDIVEAVFKREVLTSDITVYVEGGFGEVYYQGMLVADQTNNAENPVIITVDYGTTPRFEFVPAESYHLSSVLVDNSVYMDLILTEFTQSYEFPIIAESFHSLVVTFSQDGEAVIPYGSDITVFLSNAASLNFNYVSGGTAYGNEIFSLLDVVVWSITVQVDELGDQTIVALRYDPSKVPGSEEDLRLYRCDSEDAELYYKSDVNDDGVVNGQDDKIIANIVKHPKFWDPEENPEYDIDGDGFVNEIDLHIVNSMKNLDLNWIDITLYVDTENNIIYGVTEHFSIFRGR